MTLVVDGGRVASVESTQNADVRAEVIAPGLVDLQYNGGFGVEVGTRADAILHVAERLPATGVTAFLPTLVTSARATYAAAYAAFAEAVAKGVRGAKPLGMHLEGPFLSPDAAGAHHRDWVEGADPTLFEELVVDGAPLAMMTLAPERPGALERIRRLVERRVVASIGHTSASYDEVIAGIEAGATMVTHLYNAMTPLAHRAPGCVGAALSDARVTCGLIVDGVHAHAAASRIAVRAKGVERLALVTDAMSAAGMGPGDYELAGKRVIVDATSARLESGTLAGSVLTLDAAVRNVVRLGVPLEDALRMASETPARVLGLEDKGRIGVGADADLVLLDEKLHVAMTLVHGHRAFIAA